MKEAKEPIHFEYSIKDADGNILSMCDLSDEQSRKMAHVLRIMAEHFELIITKNPKQ